MISQYVLTCSIDLAFLAKDGSSSTSIIKSVT